MIEITAEVSMAKRIIKDLQSLVVCTPDSQQPASTTQDDLEGLGGYLESYKTVVSEITSILEKLLQDQNGGWFRRRLTRLAWKSKRAELDDWQTQLHRMNSYLEMFLDIRSGYVLSRMA